MHKKRTRLGNIQKKYGFKRIFSNRVVYYQSIILSGLIQIISWLGFAGFNDVQT